MKRLVAPFALFAAAAMLSACETESADFYDLDEMQADISVSKDVDSSKVHVRGELTAYNDSLKFLVLSGDDSFYANVNDGEGVELLHDSLLGMVWYSRNVFADVGDEIFVTLDRPGDAKAVSSVVVPDGVYELTASAQNASRSEDLEISWTLPTDAALDDRISIAVDGDCIDTSWATTVTVSAERVTIPADALTSADAVVDCRMKVFVTTHRKGHLSGEFRRGSIWASNANTLILTSTP